MKDHSEPTPEDVQALHQRFAKAGWTQAAWIHGNPETRHPIKVLWTRKGQQRMAKLHRMTATLGELPRRGLLAKLAAHWWWFRFIISSAEVQWRVLPIAQRWLLVVIAQTVELGPDGLPEPECETWLG